MEFKAALVIVQLTLASVYSRKSSFRDFAFRKTMKLKFVFPLRSILLSKLMLVICTWNWKDEVKVSDHIWKLRRELYIDIYFFDHVFN